MSDTLPSGSPAIAFNSAMSIKRLNLTDFRCYKYLRLELDERPVVITGNNGAGKTNLLEAISYLVPGRGLRSAKLSDVSRNGGRSVKANETKLEEGGPRWAVAAEILNHGKIVEIGTGFGTDYAGSLKERRIVKVNGKAGVRQFELGQYASALWLTPQMDQLFIGGSSLRRRFVDNLIIGMDSGYSSLVSAYDHSLKSRNRLLKNGERDDGWLAKIEDDMARFGVAVAARRKEVVTQLNQISILDTKHFPTAQMAMLGKIESFLDDSPALEVEDRIRSELSNTRMYNNEGRGPRIGPHTSDFFVQHAANGTEARQCSTGEQKALLISIIVAAICLISQEKGQAPLLLLDEIAAHLDVLRRNALFEIISAMGIQAWMTGTDELIYSTLGTLAQRFKIINAKIKQM